MQNLNFSPQTGQLSGGFGGMLQELEQEFQQLEQEVEQIGGGQDNGLGDPGGNGCGLFGGGQGSGFGSCGGQQPAPWSATNNGNGQASIDLGDGYSMQLNKANSQWTLTGPDGTVTNVSGDPHVTEGSQTFTFKNNTTFELPNGTKITDRTVPAGNGQTLSNELDITRGNQSMQVTGLASNSSSPLQITEGFNGRQLAASNFGDSVLYESGDQWLARDGQVVDSQYAAANL